MPRMHVTPSPTILQAVRLSTLSEYPEHISFTQMLAPFGHEIGYNISTATALDQDGTPETAELVHPGDGIVYTTQTPSLEEVVVASSWPRAAKFLLVFLIIYTRLLCCPRLLFPQAWFEHSSARPRGYVLPLPHCNRAPVDTHLASLPT